MPAAEPTDARRSALKGTLRELAWTIHRKAPDRAGVGGLPTTEIALLKQVTDAPGSTVGELAEALGIRQPNVSAALRVLGQRGLVARKPSPLDRRVSRVFVTELGASEHQSISDAWTDTIEGALADLPADDLASLDAALEAMQALHRSLRAQS